MRLCDLVEVNLAIIERFFIVIVKQFGLTGVGKNSLSHSFISTLQQSYDVYPNSGQSKWLDFRFDHLNGILMVTIEKAPLFANNSLQMLRYGLDYTHRFKTSLDQPIQNLMRHYSIELKDDQLKRNLDMDQLRSFAEEFRQVNFQGSGISEIQSFQLFRAAWVEFKVERMYVGISTVIVALVVAVASHVHSMFRKDWMSRSL